MSKSKYNATLLNDENFQKFLKDYTSLTERLYQGYDGPHYCLVMVPKQPSKEAEQPQKKKSFLFKY